MTTTPPTCLCLRCKTGKRLERAHALCDRCCAKLLAKLLRDDDLTFKTDPTTTVTLEVRERY